MGASYVWELFMADGHVVSISERFATRTECIEDARQHQLPIQGVDSNHVTRREPRRY